MTTAAIRWNKLASSLTHYSLLITEHCTPVDVAMPTYDYRCKACETEFALFYKTYKDYDAAHKICPNCGSEELSRLITRVAVAQPARDYTKMSSGEMLSVFDSGNPQEVGRMFQQVGGGAPELGADYHETTQRLLNGEKPEKIERDLQASKKSSES